MRKFLVFPALLLLIGILALTPVHAQIPNIAQSPLYQNTTLGQDFIPMMGEHWATTDGVGIFAFYVDHYGNILWSSGYLNSPTPSDLVLGGTFLNHTQGLLTNSFGFFTVTEGYMTTNTGLTNVLGSNSVFDFYVVWASGLNRISLIELTDPLYVNNAGVRYFKPTLSDPTQTFFGVGNSTAGVFSVGTDGPPQDITAINLANGDVIIGDTENYNSTWNANVYMYRHDSGLFTRLAGFSNNVLQYSVQPAYVAPFMYYAVGQNVQASGVSATTMNIYQASLAHNWVPNGTQITNNVLYPVKFGVATDPTHLYVAGEFGNTTFLESTNSTNQMTDNIYEIDVSTRLGANVTDMRNVYVSGQQYITGVHLYYDYVWGADQNLYLGIAYSTDGGVTFFEDPKPALSQIPATMMNYWNYPSTPSISGLSVTPWAYNPESDYLIMYGRGPAVSLANVYIYGTSVILPSVVYVHTATSSTAVRGDIAYSVTTITSANLSIQPDFITPFIMLALVALPAGVLGVLGGKYMGGLAGAFMMVLGAGIGLFAGVVLGSYPPWSIVLAVLAIATGVLGGIKTGGAGNGQ